MASSNNYARLAWTLCGLAGLSGCSASVASDEPNGSQTSAISGGAPDALNTNVFSLLVHSGNAVSACSATLIAENLLLTARHCIAENGQDPVICGQAEFGAVYDPSGVFASNALDVSRARDWYHGAEIFVPSEGNDTCGYDVALVMLKERVDRTVAIPAVPRIDRDVEKGEAYRAVGYGLTETTDYGVRRLLDEREVACEPGTCRSGVRGNEFIGTTGPCEGDSGGPAFDADGKVVGVDSRGAEDCSTPVYSTVTGWKDLIIDTARYAAKAGGYEPPFWVTTGVSDPPVEPPPPPPPPITAAVGESCRSLACAGGAACYLPNGQSEPHCVAVCKATSECGMGELCTAVNVETSVCLPKPAPSSGCQLSRSPSYGVGLVLGALGLLAVRRRRTRR